MSRLNGDESLTVFKQLENVLKIAFPALLTLETGSANKQLHSDLYDRVIKSIIPNPEQLKLVATLIPATYLTVENNFANREIFSQLLRSYADAAVTDTQLISKLRALHDSNLNNIELLRLIYLLTQKIYSRHKDCYSRETKNINNGHLNEITAASYNHMLSEPKNGAFAALCKTLTSDTYTDGAEPSDPHRPSLSYAIIPTNIFREPLNLLWDRTKKLADALLDGTAKDKKYSLKNLEIKRKQVLDTLVGSNQGSCTNQVRYALELKHELLCYDVTRRLRTWKRTRSARASQTQRLLKACDDVLKEPDQVARQIQFTKLLNQVERVNAKLQSEIGTASSQLRKVVTKAQRSGLTRESADVTALAAFIDGGNAVSAAHLAHLDITVKQLRELIHTVKDAEKLVNSGFLFTYWSRNRSDSSTDDLCLNVLYQQLWVLFDKGELEQISTLAEQFEVDKNILRDLGCKYLADNMHRMLMNNEFDAIGDLISYSHLTPEEITALKAPYEDIRDSLINLLRSETVDNDQVGNLLRYTRITDEDCVDLYNRLPRGKKGRIFESELATKAAAHYIAKRNIQEQLATTSLEDIYTFAETYEITRDEVVEIVNTYLRDNLVCLVKKQQLERITALRKASSLSSLEFGDIRPTERQTAELLATLIANHPASWDILDCIDFSTQDFESILNQRTDASHREAVVQLFESGFMQALNEHELLDKRCDSFKELLGIYLEVTLDKVGDYADRLTAVEKIDQTFYWAELLTPTDAQKDIRQQKLAKALQPHVDSQFTNNEIAKNIVYILSRGIKHSKQQIPASPIRTVLSSQSFLDVFKEHLEELILGGQLDAAEELKNSHDELSAEATLTLDPDEMLELLASSIRGEDNLPAPQRFLSHLDVSMDHLAELAKHVNDPSRLFDSGFVNAFIEKAKASPITNHPQLIALFNSYTKVLLERGEYQAIHNLAVEYQVDPALDSTAVQRITPAFSELMSLFETRYSFATEFFDCVKFKADDIELLFADNKFKISPQQIINSRFLKAILRWQTKQERADLRIDQGLNELVTKIIGHGQWSHLLNLLIKKNKPLAKLQARLQETTNSYAKVLTNAVSSQLSAFNLPKIISENNFNAVRTALKETYDFCDTIGTLESPSSPVQHSKQSDEDSRIATRSRTASSGSEEATPRQRRQKAKLDTKATLTSAKPDLLAIAQSKIEMLVTAYLQANQQAELVDSLNTHTYLFKLAPNLMQHVIEREVQYFNTRLKDIEECATEDKVNNLLSQWDQLSQLNDAQAIEQIKAVIVSKLEEKLRKTPEDWNHTRLLECFGLADYHKHAANERFKQAFEQVTAKILAHDTLNLSDTKKLYVHCISLGTIFAADMELASAAKTALINHVDQLTKSLTPLAGNSVTTIADLDATTKAPLTALDALVQSSLLDSTLVSRTGAVKTKIKDHQTAAALWRKLIAATEAAVAQSKLPANEMSPVSLTNFMRVIDFDHIDLWYIPEAVIAGIRSKLSEINLEHPYFSTFKELDAALSKAPASYATDTDAQENTKRSLEHLRKILVAMPTGLNSASEGSVTDEGVVVTTSDSSSDSEGESHHSHGSSSTTRTSPVSAASDSDYGTEPGSPHQRGRAYSSASTSSSQGTVTLFAVTFGPKLRKLIKLIGTTAEQLSGHHDIGSFFHGNANLQHKLVNPLAKALAAETSFRGILSYHALTTQFVMKQSVVTELVSNAMTPLLNQSGKKRAGCDKKFEEAVALQISLRALLIRAGALEKLQNPSDQAISEIAMWLELCLTTHQTLIPKQSTGYAKLVATALNTVSNDLSASPKITRSAVDQGLKSHITKMLKAMTDAAEAHETDVLATLKHYFPAKTRRRAASPVTFGFLQRAHGTDDSSTGTDDSSTGESTPPPQCVGSRT